MIPKIQNEVKVSSAFHGICKLGASAGKRDCFPSACFDAIGPFAYTATLGSEKFI